MNKLGLVLSLAAVAAVSGCLDPQYRSKRTTTQEPTVGKPAVSSEPVEPVTPVDVTPDPAPAVNVDVVDTPAPKPVEVKPVVKEPEFTTYIIQRGDTLSKISKRYNIKIDAIKSSNPQIKNDVIRLGQKIRLPGKVDVGEQTVPAGAFASNQTKRSAPAAASKKDPAPAKAYTGATKEYIVKNGDTLGGIAIASGLTVRQLKELNGLSKDMIRVGQKLKVPASKVEKNAASPAPDKKVAEKKVDTVKPTEAAADKPVVADEADKEEPVADTPAVEPVPAPQPAAKTDAKYVDYTVQDGDDL
ncbi:MAG: LysM peptidoglycan-binding domain-containing protein, partial [Kiritimatiellae bacterium]|nr:LysM peptidoglycan-binding domain-containing protein [Kiritimatiellia bacterium]